MIKGIVFDKDGTLLDYEAFWVPVAEGAVRRLQEELSARQVPQEELLKSVGAYEGISGVLCYGTYGDIAECFGRVLSAHGVAIPCDLKERTAAAFCAAMPEGKLVPTCAELGQALMELRTRGLVTAVITSDNEEATELCLAGLGIHGCFDRIYTDDGSGPPKPDPHFLHRFCEDFSLSPHEVIMVGDTPTDMKFAKNSGAVGVAVSATPAAKALLEPLTRYILPHVGHLPEFLEGMESN